jgi:site-specific DNA recombinase
MLVLEAVRRWAEAGSPNPSQPTDRDFLTGQVRRITLHPDTIEIAVGGGEGRQDPTVHSPQIDPAASSSGQTLTVRWTGTRNNGPRGITAQSFGRPSVDPRTRDALLSAIAKARAWIADLTEGRVVSFAAIAEREGKVERHVRLLAPLAFVSPRVIAAIADDRAPAGTTVTALARVVSPAVV